MVISSLVDEENPKAALLAANRSPSADTSRHARNNKHFDHSNYWKLVVQDYAKKVEDLVREKEGVYIKQQANRFVLGY
jgi:hypothetical protein